MTVQILLPESQARQLIDALKRHRDREIGGILMGEHIAEDQFRICDLTVQARGGTSITFVRAIEWISIPLRRFFRRTRHNYTRFNYLGEWHSHPGLPLTPSTRDCETMWDIVNDPSVGANFVVLFVVHLDELANLAGRVEAFLPQRERLIGELIMES